MPLLILLFTILPFLSKAQSADHRSTVADYELQDTLPYTLLWKIEGNGLRHPSYLYGTMHTDDDEAFQFMDSVLITFRSCEEFAMEVNPDSIEKKSLGTQALLPEGVTLKDLLSPEDYNLVKKQCWRKLHMPMFLIDHIRPLYVMQMLEEGGSTNPNQIVDMYFYRLALKQNKPVHGLEKVEDQLSVLNSIPLEKQAALLSESVRSPDNDVGMDSILSFYNHRDLNKIYLATVSDTSFGKAFNQKLIDDRNAVMAHGISKLAQQHPVFTAVGAAHLPGNQGIIARLRRMGYRVSPVMSPIFLRPSQVRKQAK